ncbi:MAG: MBL fold metallo-hydrolase [Myxococcota bacterium]|nr:MBL fold metallo-hydrolase [Myxococcota bacterium]
MANITWTIGKVRISRVEEVVAPLVPGEFFPDLAPETLARHESWLKPHFLDADGNLLLSVHGLVLESQGRRILVDTCVGDRPVPGFEALVGGDRFLTGMVESGFPRESIDVVLCTHLHFDHVGCNTIREGDRLVPTFPNARYLFARTEYEHWEADPDKAFTPTFDETVKPIIEAGLADLVDMDHRITDEVQLEPTPGHTPGHVAVRISSEGAEAMITGDLTHHPVQWAEPDLGMPADSDGAQAAATRHRLLREHADGPLLVIGTHYAEPCSGRLVKDGSGGHRFEVAPR